MISDFVEDLTEFEVRDVEEAIRTYRRDPTSEFFPKVGKLRELASEARRERVESERWHRTLKLAGPKRALPRPHGWWWRPRQYWKSEWREEDIPEEYRGTYERRKLNLGLG